jgi:uncharacterized protein YecE (DUF72 family)
MQLLIGTSGFSYPAWRGGFYPEKLPESKMLGHYAGIFRAVEINNSFYRMPTAEVLARWAGETPPEFRFALKSPAGSPTTSASSTRPRRSNGWRRPRGGWATSWVRCSFSSRRT